MKLELIVRWIAFFGVLLTLAYYVRHPLTTTATIKNVRYTVEVAATPQEKEVGLGGRDSLKPRHGMLFPYDHAERFSYWMKGMRFPIDIIWIRDNRIVDISKHVPVSKGGVLPVYSAREPVNLVLEVAAGESDRNGFQIGDIVVIDN